MIFNNRKRGRVVVVVVVVDDSQLQTSKCDHVRLPTIPEVFFTACMFSGIKNGCYQIDQPVCKIKRATQPATVHATSPGKILLSFWCTYTVRFHTFLFHPADSQGTT